MRWRAFSPEDVEDLNVESMSAAGKNDTQCRSRCPASSAFQGEVECAKRSRVDHVLVNASGTDAVRMVARKHYYVVQHSSTPARAVRGSVN